MCPPSQVLECIRMSEETTTSSSRIFVKILFQELCAYMGLPRLNQRLKDQYELTLTVTETQMDEPTVSNSVCVCVFQDSAAVL